MKPKISVNRGDALKLRFTVSGKCFTLTNKLKNTTEGWKAAEALASQVELDILSGNFDTTLAKYKTDSRLKPAIDATSKGETLQSVWAEYLAYRSKSVEASTMKKQFGPMTNYLNSIPFRYFCDHIKIKNRIIRDKTPNGAKRLLTQLSAMGRWAVEFEVIADNPFEGAAKTVKIPKSQDDDELDLKPFTKAERGAIIEWFKQNRYYSHYSPMIEFLFFTGCRPSEALGLRWKRVGSDKLRFDKALVTGMGSEPRKGLKTQGYREVPINDQLRVIIESARDFLPSKWINAYFMT